MKDFIKEGLGLLGIDCDAEKIEKLEAYYTELSAWNPRTGFVKAEGKELLVKHFFDSLAGVPVLRAIDFETAADAGSGAGFPGIPLSIFFPEKKFTLIERSSKKTAFLENCKILLPLENVIVEESEIERTGKKFDLVVFRAFRNFNSYLRPIAGITNDSGCLAAYKGKISEIEREMQLAGIEKYSAVKVRVPFMDEERHIVVAERKNIKIFSGN